MVKNKSEHFYFMIIQNNNVYTYFRTEGVIFLLLNDEDKINNLADAFMEQVENKKREKKKKT